MTLLLGAAPAGDIEQPRWTTQRELGVALGLPGYAAAAPRKKSARGFGFGSGSATGRAPRGGDIGSSTRAAAARAAAAAAAAAGNAGSVAAAGVRWRGRASRQIPLQLNYQPLCL
jgi:hypothetical protein